MFLAADGQDGSGLHLKKLGQLFQVVVVPFNQEKGFTLFKNSPQRYIASWCNRSILCMKKGNQLHV